ncbi:MAG: four helix bundle protein [Patescibacteria group bacterium]
MEKFGFLKWPVYQESRELSLVILRIVKELPQEYRFILGNQLIRSAFSITLNIAEGSGRSSHKEFCRFIDIAQGSLYETLAGVDIFRYNKLITEQEFAGIVEQLNSVSRQMGGLKKRAKSL